MFGTFCGEKKGSRRWRRKNCGGKRMISPERAIESHAEGGRKRAAVCSSPPSEVGVGMIASVLVGSEPGVEESDGRGRKYKYICVVNRFGILVGVIQRVKGMRLSAATISPRSELRSSIQTHTYVWKPAALLNPITE